MPPSLAISVHEYLENAYRPDCEYLDGQILERNVGEYDHSRLQTLLSRYLSNREREWEMLVLVEQRVQVRPTRYRVPDILVLAASAVTAAIVTEPPLLCIEILSPRDRMTEMQSRIDDYLAFGVPTVWVIDPAPRRGFVYTTASATECKDGMLSVTNSQIRVPLFTLGD